MAEIIAYVTILAALGLFETIWLSRIALPLYKPVLGDMMVEQVRIMPAVVFYLFFPIGLVVFAVMPGVQDGSVLTVFTSGALLGALCFATYDLTNYATLKTWTLEVTLIDIGYGAVLAGTCSAIAFLTLQLYL